MKKLIFICSLFFSAILFAQNYGSINGTVLDSEMNNEPILFANVSIKHTSKKEQTNFRGNFKITNIKLGKYTLVIAYTGYETIEIPVHIKKNKTIKINSALTPRTIDLEDITLFYTSY